jgi:hypothetical protein
MRDLDVQSLLFADDGRPYNQMDKIEVHAPIVDDNKWVYINTVEYMYCRLFQMGSHHETIGF